MKLRWIVSTLFFLAACPLPAAAQDDDYRRCREYRESNPDLALQYCTAAIQSGNLSHEQLAEARNNRGGAFARKGEYDRAMQDFDQAIRLNPDFGAAYVGRGFVRFLGGQFAAAQQDFARALQSMPTSSYAAIWLYLATAKQGQDASSELSKNATQFDPTVWPVQVLNLYLDETTVEWVLYTAKDPDQKTDREHHCQAYFYLGEYALLAGKREEAKHLFQKSVGTGVAYSFEYSAAQTELKRLALHK